MSTVVDLENISLPPELKNRQWLTYEEFGALLGLKAGAIRQWRRTGIIKARQFTPKCFRIHVSELERLRRGELMEEVTHT